MKRIMLLMVLGLLALVLSAQDVEVSYWYTDNQNLTTPLYGPDGTTPCPDGWVVEVVLPSASGTYNYETDPHGSQLSNDGAVQSFNGVNGDIGQGFFTLTFFVWEDTEGSPAEPCANCLEQVYLRIYNAPTISQATHYRTSDFITGPAAGSSTIEGHEVSTWGDWQLVPMIPNPAEPILVSPANGAENVMNPVLDWDQIDNPFPADGFYVYYGNTPTPVSSGTMVTISDPMVTSYTIPNLPYSGQTLYWTVQAFTTDERGNVTVRNVNTRSNGRTRNVSSYPAPWSFTVSDIDPATPVLVSPANNAMGVMNPVLDWDYTQNLTPAVAFRLYWGTAPNVTQTGTIVDINDVAITEYALPTQVYDGHIIYWSVQAVGALGDLSQLPNTWHFNVADINPAAPTLVTPTNGATALMNPVTLTWTFTDNPLSPATGFKVYYGTTNNPVANGTQVVINNTTTLSYQLPAMPYNGQMWYWTVRSFNAFRESSVDVRSAGRRDAVDSRNDSDIPTPFSFSIADINPATPVLTGPVTGSVLQLNPVTVSWTFTDNPQSPATGFKLYYGTTPNPVQGGQLVTINNTTTLSYQLPILPYQGQTLYWTVRSFNAMRNDSDIPTPFTFVMFDDPNDAGSDIIQAGQGEDPINITSPDWPGGLINVNLVNGTYNGRYIVAINEAPLHANIYNVLGSLHFTLDTPGEYQFNIDLLGINPTPDEWAYHNGTQWTVNGANGSITGTLLSFTHTITQTAPWVEVVVNDEGSLTLPMTLNTQSATHVAETNNMIQVLWTTSNESSMIGYHVYRNETNDFATAEMMTTAQITALNAVGPNNYEFIDIDAWHGQEWYYWVEATAVGGWETVFEPMHVLSVGTTDPATPALTTTLRNAYPNPFNPVTHISFDVKQGDRASLKIYNLKGQLIRDFGQFETGSQKIIWNGTDTNNQKVASGVFFYRLDSKDVHSVKKVLMLK